MKKIMSALGILLVVASVGFAKDVTVSWDTQPEAVKYNVYIAEMFQDANKNLYSSAWTFNQVVNAPTVTTVITGLDDTKTFSYYVSAVNAAGIESQASNIAVDRIVPGRVTGVTR